MSANSFLVVRGYAPPPLNHIFNKLSQEQQRILLDAAANELPETASGLAIADRAAHLHNFLDDADYIPLLERVFPGMKAVRTERCYVLGLEVYSNINGRGRHGSFEITPQQLAHWETLPVDPRVVAALGQPRTFVHIG